MAGGGHAGPADAAVALRFQDRRSLASLALGEIGDVGAAIVEGRVLLRGSMRDLMAAAAGLLRGDPARANAGWWQQMMARARSRAVHTIARDARQVQFHYDLSDDFYALWLDARRVYSCAYYPRAGMTLAQGAGSQARPHLPQAAPGSWRAPARHRRGLGRTAAVAAEHYGVDATGITLSRNQQPMCSA